MSETKTISTGLCPICKNPGTVTVPKDQYEDWVQNKTHIQTAFPDMSIDDREQLISGAHGACFDELFGDDED